MMTKTSNFTIAIITPCRHLRAFSRAWEWTGESSEAPTRMTSLTSPSHSSPASRPGDSCQAPYLDIAACCPCPKRKLVCFRHTRNYLLARLAPRQSVDPENKNYVFAAGTLGLIFQLRQSHRAWTLVRAACERKVEES